MAFDALAEHASPLERRELFRKHRGWLLGIGVFCGYLGAAPSLIWASGAMFIAMAPILVPVAIWIYTLIFAFSSLWFAHYCLAALQLMRTEAAVAAATAAAVPVIIPALVALDAPTVTLSDDTSTSPNTQR